MIERGKPKMVVSDNGGIDQQRDLTWLSHRRRWALIDRPGQPVRCFIESFNGRLRDDCLNETMFTSWPGSRCLLRCVADRYNAAHHTSNSEGRTLPRSPSHSIRSRDLAWLWGPQKKSPRQLPSLHMSNRATKSRARSESELAPLGGMSGPSGKLRS